MTREASIAWRRLDMPGHDACTLSRAADGWRLAGTAVFTVDEERCQLAYVVECDVAWLTREATVKGWRGREALSIAIERLSGGGWSLNGVLQTAVNGCIDVDLGFTPATNLIPLRRLALAVGADADALAAWLAFPELMLQRLEQRYRRVADDQYEYRAPTVDYVGMLDVDTTGFITRYPGLWEQEV